MTLPQVSTRLGATDIIGRWRVRLGFRRSDYRVTPGLYRAGVPDPHSPVLVTANYKLSFDALRSRLQGVDAWLLVLDTKGVNVWCAAGKGTFGTDELVRRMEATGLAQVVGHRTIVVPQLGASGVAAHEVREGSGFRVVYGPVRAADLPAFLRSGMRATPEMRRVSFTMKERLVVTWVEIVRALRFVVPPVGLAVVASTVLYRTGVVEVAWGWLPMAVPFAAALVAGLVLVPALLPWLPGRAFSMKGAVVGAAASAAALLAVRGQASVAVLLAVFLAATALTSYVAMSFTGSTTFTSASGVEKEMRRAIPLQLAALAGAAFLIVAHFGGAL